MSQVVRRSVSFGSFGRDFDSLSAWNSSLTNANYAPGSIACAVLYNDAIFDEHGLVITAESNIKGLLITAAEDNWHKGDTSQGVLFQPSVSHGPIISMSYSGPWRIERLRFNSNGLYSTNFSGILRQETSVNTAYPHMNWIDKCIITGGTSNNPARAMCGIHAKVRPMRVTNSLLYNILSNGSATSTVAFGIGGDDKLEIYNCTLDNVEFANANGITYGLLGQSTANSFFGNNLVLRTQPGSSTAEDVSAISARSNNGSSDATGDIPNLVHTDEFANPAGGDYSLKAGASSEGAGFNGWCWDTLRYDITGDQRKDQAFDLGAYNNLSGYISGGGGGGTITKFVPLGD
ncbi:MAG: hypothetical protein AAF394_02505 [Planctomycetota bacterium]